MKSRHPDAYPPAKKLEFWNHFQELGNAAAAAERSGIPPDTGTRWIRDYRRRLKKWEQGQAVKEATGGDAH